MKKIFFVLFACFLMTVSAGCVSAAEIGAEVGNELAATEYVDMNGKAVTIPPKDGKVYVINLWATWCPPCRQEMPELQKFYNKYRNDPKVGIYLIDHAESKEDVQKFMKDSNYDMPVLLDARGNGVKMLLTRAIPTTVVIDRYGVVVFRKIGPVTLAELEDAIVKANK